MSAQYQRTVTARVQKVIRTEAFPMFSIAELADGSRVPITRDRAEENSLQFAKSGNYFVTPSEGWNFFANEAELSRRGYVKQ